MKILFENYNKANKALQFSINGEETEIAEFDTQLVKRKKFTKIPVEIPADNDRDVYTLKLGEEKKITDFLFELALFLRAHITADNWREFINSLETAIKVNLEFFYLSGRNFQQTLPSDMLIPIIGWLGLNDQASLHQVNQSINHTVGYDYKKLLQHHFPNDYQNLNNAKKLTSIAHDWLDRSEQNKLKQIHKNFGYVGSNDELVVDYKNAFSTAHKKNYHELTKRHAWLITLFKEGMLAEIKNAHVTLEELLLNTNEERFIDSLPHDHRQTVLDYFYQETILPFYTDSPDKMNVDKVGPSSTKLLHWAVLCRQSLATLSLILEKNPIVSAFTRHHKSALMLAAQNNDLNAVMCLTPPNNMKATLEDCNLAINMAASNGHFNVVVHLTSLPDISIKVALVTAIERNNIEIFKYLTSLPLFSHADIIALDVTSTYIIHFSTFHYAAKWNRIEMVKHLATLEGFDIDASTDGINAFMIAASNGKVAMMRYLVTQPGNLINVTSSDGKNALFLAASKGHTDAVKYLITLPGMNIQGASDGTTVLMIAARNGHEDTVRYLAPFVNINEGVTQGAYRGYTALMAVTNPGVDMEGRIKMVKTLISLPGNNINATTQDGETALTLAIRKKK